MSLFVRTIKRSLRLLPAPLRNTLRSSRAAVAIRNVAAKWKWRGKSHDEIYDEQYFAFVDRTSTECAATMAKTIVEAFHPNSVIDVGCGTGALLAELRSQGVRVKGLERARAALALCRARQIDVREFDVLSDSAETAERFDVVVSMEVGAQLPPSCADRYVALLSSLGPVQVFSVEQPGGGDRLPLNEQPHEYWIKKFAANGFVIDSGLTQKWRGEWTEHNVTEWFCRNVMVFQRG